MKTLERIIETGPNGRRHQHRLVDVRGVCWFCTVVGGLPGVRRVRTRIHTEDVREMRRFLSLKGAAK